MPDGAHHSDLSGPLENVTADVASAREQIVAALEAWLFPRAGEALVV